VGSVPAEMQNFIAYAEALVVWSLNSATYDLSNSAAYVRVCHRPDLHSRGDEPWAIAIPKSSH